MTCYGGPPDYAEVECFKTQAEHCLVVYELDEPYQTPNGDWITLDHTLHYFGDWIRQCDYANSYLGQVPRSYFEGFDYACWIYRYCKPADLWSCPSYAEECEPPGVDGEGRLNPCGEPEDCLFDSSSYCYGCPGGTISCSYSMCAYPDAERRAACLSMGSGSFAAISDTGRCGDTRFSMDAYCNIRWWPTDEPPPCFFACDLAALMMDQVAAYGQRTRIVIGDDPLPQYRPAPAEWWIVENWPDFDPDGGTSPGDPDPGGDPGWPECGIDQPCPWNGATGFGDGPDMPQQSVELPGNLWGDGSWLPASCPADESLDFGALGSFDVPFSAMCEVAAALGRWVVIVALIAGAGIIFGSRQV